MPATWAALDDRATVWPSGLTLINPQVHSGSRTVRSGRAGPASLWLPDIGPKLGPSPDDAAKGPSIGPVGLLDGTTGFLYVGGISPPGWPGGLHRPRGCRNMAPNLPDVQFKGMKA
jgi:hypothetical protein